MTNINRGMATTSGAHPKPGMGDLEKELICSICTELLYQPLTLLDCLHTFCGSCLKEWFSWQAVRARSSSSEPRFTCPACRAVVRATRPNATVTTLLDMVLQATPDRDRSAEEKEEIAKKYKPGDQVLVSPEASDSETDQEERQLISNVRELSLTEVSNSHRRGASNGRRPRSADTRDRQDDERRPPHHDERIARRQVQHTAARNAARAGTTVGNGTDSPRRIEHQSSLRSLLSASDVEDNAQEEIVRLIMEEGLLDGIDISGLNQAQEEELSDRLVQIFLSRHPDRSNLARRGSEQPERPRASQHHRSRSQTAQTRSPTINSTETSSRHPPVSSRNQLEATLDPRVHRRRASDETRRRRTSPTPVAAASTSETTLRPAMRSSSDITSHATRTSSSRPRTRGSSTTSISRNSFEPEGRSSDMGVGRSRHGSQQSVTGRQATGSSMTDSPSTITPTERNFSLSSPSLPGITADVSSSTGHQTSARQNQASRPIPARQAVPRTASTHYAEPSISCERCGKTGIQYELHKCCLKCKDGNFQVCFHCFRIDQGCPHYYGVGSVGESNFNKAHHPATRATAEFPHVLKSQRYRRPKQGSARGTANGKQMTCDNPASRLEDGMFCDSCQAVANGCFWQCEECNEGEWGYCRRCVNQGRCCNHPLLPVRRIVTEPPTTSSADATPSTVPSAAQKFPTGLKDYEVLSFSTECDVCKYPIAPSSTRFHCLQCNDGDYDVCTNCYLKSVVSGRISKENGHGGWRRCLKGHRMIVIGYEDHEKGQRRVIVRDIVGGYTLKDENDEYLVPPSSTSSASIASPELGTGDWSWKEGNTKRKKAGRLRTSHMSTLNSNASPSPSQPSSTTPSISTAQPDRYGAFPPDGGYGLVLCAKWSYFADDNCPDELSFPRGAEITEADNINDEWYWGYYAGKKGLFPGAFCTLVREVA